MKGKKGKKIFLIEDQKDLFSVLNKFLAIRGYELEHSMEGEEGYRKLCQIKPDFLLLDILLPKMNGLEVLAKLRSHPDKKISQIPVMIITNYPEVEYQKKAEELGVVDFVVKSDSEVEQIVKKMEDYLKKTEHGNK